MRIAFGVFALLAACEACAVCCVASIALAQFHRPTDPVWTPPGVLALRDDAMAMDVNPASLAQLPSYSLAYLHARSSDPGWPAGGDAFFAASPLAFGVASGLSLQDVRPATGAFGIPHRMLSWTLAFAQSARLAFGGSLHWLASPDPRVDGLTSLDLGLAWQPAAALGFSLAGRDLLVSRGGAGYQLDLGPSLVGSVTLHPLGMGPLAFDLALALDRSANAGARLATQLRVPWVGAASLALEAERIGSSGTTVRALAGLTVNWGSSSAGAALAGDAQDRRVRAALVALRLEGSARAGIPGRNVALNIEIAGSVGPRRLIAIALQLDRALHDERVAGVLLRMRGTDLGLAYAQELRLQIEALRKAGKPVVCHLELASGSEYYACAGATHVALDPAGGVRLLGPSLKVLLLGDMLRKLGVRADFVRIGKYKAAPEQLMSSRLSEPAREQSQALLDDLYGMLVRDLSQNLRRSEAAVRALIDEGPYLATAARQRRLVAHELDELALNEPLKKFLGELPLLAKLPARDGAARRFARRVAVVVVDHSIADGENRDVPLVDIHVTGGRTVAQTLEALAADAGVAAIVLRVDSPGGAVLASDQIWRAIRRARKRKPLIASMGALAASGGYYVASAADEIWADPASVTGSIGIFYGKVDVAELAGRLGIGVEHMRRGRRAGAQSLYRPFTPDERAALSAQVRLYYERFLERVAKGRKRTRDEIDALARGRVWSGKAALAQGLVDRLGGFASALARARQLTGLAADAPVVVLPERKLNLTDHLLGQWAARVQAAPASGQAPAARGAPGLASELVPRELRAALELALVLRGAQTGAALARMPYVVHIAP